jgi:DNA-binding FadR family transcriptional regulator
MEYLTLGHSGLHVSSKLAATVAKRIVGDIIASGWPVGQVLGSEAELLKQYGVSRAVFREAVRLLEHQQMARMRRGPGGGLVVTEPTIETIIDSARLYLYRVDAHLDEVFETRLVLEGLVTQLAPGRLDEAGLEGLRRLVREEEEGIVTDRRALHAFLASGTKNLALELFVELLNRVSLLYFADATRLTSKTVNESLRAHAQIAEAVIDGNEDLALLRMRKHLSAEAAFIRSRRSTRQLLKPVVAINGPPGSKRGEEVAREIFASVLQEGLAPKQFIGSEPDLMDRYGVSRAIIREAARLLEHHDIAGMRRGPGGGLFVLAPSIDAVTNVVALFLERHGISVADVFELRMGVELAIVDVVIDKMNASGAKCLHEALQQEVAAADQDFTIAVHDLHETIASISGNRVLELVSLVLIRLSHLHEASVLSSRDRRKLGTEVTRTHGALAEALIARDRQLAKHRMARHLEVLSTFFR